MSSGKPTCTVLVLLLTGLSLATASGAAASSWEVPARMVGDLGVFEARSTVEHDDGVEEQVTRYRFEWLGVEPWRMPDSWRSAEVLALQDVTEEHERGMLPAFQSRVESLTHAPLAATTQASAAWSASTGSQETMQALLHEFGASMLPCGWINGFQSGEDGRPWLLGDCGLGEEGRLEIKVVGTVEHDGHEVLHLHGDRENGTLDAWLRRDIPYPVHMEQTITQGPFHITRVIDLVSFAPGDTPLAPVDVPRTTPIPAVGLVDRGRHGPESPMADEGYTVAKAIEEASQDLEQDELRAYLDEHPDWYVARAEWYEKGVSSDRMYGWDLTLWDGSEGLDVTVLHDTGDRVPAAAGQPVVGELQRKDELFVWVRDTWFAEDAPPAPSQVPDPEDVRAAWQAFMGEAGDKELWGFSLARCSGCDGWLATGDVPTAAMAVSRSDLFDLLGAPAQASHDEGSSLVVDLEGQITGLWTMRRSYERQASSPLPLAAGPEPWQRAEPERDDGTLLALIPGGKGIQVAAGVGFLGLLGAALWAAWPTLKAFPALGLFSRLRRDEILEHPVRERVAGIIETRPGIHYQDILKATGIGKGALEHHLKKLVAARVVVAHEGMGYKCYFPRGFDRRSMDAAAATKAAGARAILQAIGSVPGVSAQRAGEMTGLSPATVHRHVERLCDAGLVQKRRGASRGTSLHPTPLAREWVGAAA